MKEPAWEKCQYYSWGHCPHHRVIDRAYLIPQLLKPSQIQAARAICGDCHKYFDEKRKYQRTRRPFKIVVINQEPLRRIEGIIVDLSIKGARVKLDHWTDFDNNEDTQLQLYIEDKDSDEKKVDIISFFGKIKRLIKETRELAIVFSEHENIRRYADI